MEKKFGRHQIERKQTANPHLHTYTRRVLNIVTTPVCISMESNR